MATGTEEFIDLTTADVFLVEKWSKEATVARQNKLVFAANVDRSGEAELRPGQILRRQAISNLAARAKSANTAITYETVTETEATVTVNQYYYAAFAIEDVIKPMIALSLVEKYIPKLGYALALQEDDDLAALIDDGTITQEVGTLATDLTYDNLLRADQYLNDANVPEESRVIIISNAQRAGLLKLDHFINKDYADTRSGLLGSWLGQYPILVTGNTDGTNAAGHDNVMMHEEAIMFIQQLQPSVDKFYDFDYKCAKVSALETWGRTIVRADHAVWMKGS